MQWFRALFLVLILVGPTGYRFRCWFLCVDQTSTQNNYIEERDRCRDYAQLKVDMALKNSHGPIDDKARKSQLVSLFSECMSNNGWTVGDTKSVAAPAPSPVPAIAAPSPAMAAGGPPAMTASTAATTAATAKASLTRSAECMFARHAAANSSISAARAKACDLECSERLRAAPDAPRPAACPADVTPDKSWGVEREN